MDSLDSTYGLNVSTGNAPSAKSWAEFVRALQMPESSTADSVAAGLGTNGPAAALQFGTVLEDLGGVSDPISAKTSEVVQKAGATALKAVLQKLELLDRKRALLSAAHSLTADALVPLSQAAAQSFNLPLSQPLLELVQKMSREAITLRASERAHADQSFRGLIEHLVERWSESQVNAGAMSFADLFGDTTRHRSTLAPEHIRVIALSLESGAIGTVVWASVKEQSRTEKGTRDLITMLARAPESRAADMISEQTISPTRLIALLREEPIDFDAVDMVTRRLGAAAIKPLLDELVEATHRGTRRSIMDRLVSIGPEIAPLVQERLADNRWYVVRNMIALLRECGCEIDQALLDRFSNHEDPRVRREMLQLRMESPALRSNALTSALLDKDKSVLRAALQAARADFPPAAVASLAKRVTESDFPPEFRVMSLYLLGKSGNVAALDALLAFVNGGRTLLGKVKLANNTPEMLAALSGLARSWSSERRARELLDIAEKSKDSQILNALNSVAGGD